MSQYEPFPLVNPSISDEIFGFQEFVQCYPRLTMAGKAVDFTSYRLFVPESEVRKHMGNRNAKADSIHIFTNQF